MLADLQRTLMYRIDEAAKKLPDGWTIQLLVWQNSISLTLEDPNGQTIPQNDLYAADDMLGVQIDKCVAHAILWDPAY